ncbi:MAG: energy-coupling factor ABC transporter ATP-binding protein, partial [Oscillochloris sp.]|nr:energy-coupling factor ABC transporter ATP-binding protein [Oscillochloris sp.]
MTMLAFDDLHYGYPGGTPALCGATLRLAAGARLALLGRNGSGKSTLLMHANGLLRPSQGSVRVAGSPLDYSRQGLRAARRQVGLVFQNPDDQLFSANVAQDISFGPLNLGLSVAEARARVAEAAALCDVSDLLDRPTHALSGGQKARVALAGVLAMQPLALLADEVTAGLDPWAHRQVLAIFARLAARGTAVLLATHDVALARRWADQVAVMSDGRVVACAPPA